VNGVADFFPLEGAILSSTPPMCGLFNEFLRFLKLVDSVLGPDPAVGPIFFPTNAAAAEADCDGSIIGAGPAAAAGTDFSLFFAPDFFVSLAMQGVISEPTTNDQ
jgi:hypothetical protein